MSQYGGSIPGSLISGTIETRDGDALLSTSPESESGGFGPSVRRFVTSGVLNGDFAAGLEGQVLDRELPFWAFAQSSGSSVEAYREADASSASGYRIRMAMLAGAAGDEGSLEQLLPVNGSQGRSFVYLAAATFRTSSVVNGITLRVSAQFLKADGLTTTGASDANQIATSSVGANTTRDLIAAANSSGIVPVDAYWLRIRVGIIRAGAATTDTVTVYINEARAIVGGTQILIADDTTFTTYTAIYQSSGVLHLAPGQNSNGHSTGDAYVSIDSAGPITAMSDQSTGLIVEDRLTGAYVEMTEMTTPAAPSSNKGRLFLRDNGAGKTQLCVIFNTGAVQVIATQP